MNVTNTCEIVRGKCDAAFRLGQETLQRPFRILILSLRKTKKKREWSWAAVF